ncbi:MAG: 30S ribosomal protein S16 [Candidatus Brennerbacteria bacterium]|nr:30S ribosomal protein S16 [Candidatus Brennerbacteria bacterium]
MLAIKLKRIGKKHQASFRVVVAEKRSKVQGRFVEDLGWVNPRTNTRSVDTVRASYWLSVGAQPTPTAWNLLVKTGVVRGKKIPLHGKSKQSVSTEAATDKKVEASVAVSAPIAKPAEENKPETTSSQ